MSNFLLQPHSTSDKVAHCLAAIERHEPHLRAMIATRADDAVQRAKMLDEAEASGRRAGLLHGFILTLKDLIAQQGIATTNGSNFEPEVPLADATIVKRLNDAGATILGKANLHEFAYGGT